MGNVHIMSTCRWYCWKMIVAVVFIFGCLQGYPCGILFSSNPQLCGFFEGVDRFGNVQFTIKLGEITAVQKGTQPIPIYAIFNSDNATVSPSAGYGWTVPLFESRFYQTDPGVYCMVQPDGQTRYFVADKKTPSFLQGKRPWSATIQGGVITAQCMCKDQAKTLLTFRQGRLTSMTVREGKYEFEYAKEALTDIRQGVRSLVKVIPGAKAERVSTLEFPDKRRVSMTLVDRPQLSVIKDQVSNVGSLKSLGSVKEGQQTIFSAEYGVSETYTPFMRVSDRMIVWNPTKHFITQDGDWTYTIKQPARGGNNAAIGRTNSVMGQAEYIFYDLEKGVDTIETADGDRMVTWKFTSGQMQGLIRKKEMYQEGNLQKSEAYSYDEKGRFRRHRQVTFDTGTPFIVEQVFDEQQRPITLQRGTNRLDYVYHGNSFVCEALIYNGALLKANTPNGPALAKAYLERQKK
jgi:hypothetical protein